MIEVSTRRDVRAGRWRRRPVAYEAGEGPEGVEEGVGGGGRWHLRWGKADKGGREGREGKEVQI